MPHNTQNSNPNLNRFHSLNNAGAGYPDPQIRAQVLTMTPNLIPSMTDSAISFDAPINSVQFPSGVRSASNRDRYYCNQCKMKGHSKECCFKLNYPAGSSYVSVNESIESEAPIQGLSPRQYKTLIALLNTQSQLSVSATANSTSPALNSSFSGPTSSDDWDS